LTEEYFDSTRDEPDDFAFEVSLQTAFAQPTGFDVDGAVTEEPVVFSIPLWHFNQYSNGVTLGVNGGGPDPAGMRNIINLDRMDAGYSPLWNLNWMTELPSNYAADGVSNAKDIDLGVGFKIFVTPMFVNCPDIGSIGTEENVASAGFSPEIDATQKSTLVQGSHASLIFKEGEAITFLAGDTEIASTKTNVMGAYEIELESCLIPSGTSELQVKAGGIAEETDVAVKAGGEVIRTIPVTGDASSFCGDSGAGDRFAGAFAVLCSVVICLLLQ